MKAFHPSEPPRFGCVFKVFHTVAKQANFAKACRDFIIPQTNPLDSFLAQLKVSRKPHLASWPLRQGSQADQSSTALCRQPKCILVGSSLLLDRSKCWHDPIGSGTPGPATHGRPRQGALPAPSPMNPHKPGPAPGDPQLDESKVHLLSETRAIH